MNPPQRAWASLWACTLLVLAALPVGSTGSPLPQALSTTLDAPRWAVGFSWTYNYDGPYTQSIGSGSITYAASHINDTYTSRVVGEVSPAAGPSWLIRNDHAGTMEGNITTPIGRYASTATFTSVTFAVVTKADYAIVNFTQDLNMSATSPIGPVSGSAHNETLASPPFVQLAFATPADGTLWPIVTNMTSTGWYQIGTGGQTATSGYFAANYNLSVTGTQMVTVPAGTFESYNISGGGTADNNGNVYSFTEHFFWSPLVQNKVIDEAGYLLIDYDVNRAPELVTPLPPLNVTAGQGADIDLTTYFDDPDGDALTISCQAPSGLNCTVGAGDVLNVTADPGLNATFNLTLTVDDGRPGGRATFTLVVLVTGAGSTNQPPVALAHGTLTTAEDTPFPFVVADYFSDPDDGIAQYQGLIPPTLTSTNATTQGVDLVPAANFFGTVQFTWRVFDFGGLSASSSFTLDVTPVNDAPTVAPVGPTTKSGHLGTNLTIAATGNDVDGDVLSYEWQLDGAPLSSGSSVTFPASVAGPGAHTLRVVVSDPSGANASLSYGLFVFTGPQIVSTVPGDLSYMVGLGSTVAFEVTAQDADSAFLDYRWKRDGVEFAAGAGFNQTTVAFANVGTFVVRATVADNGSEAFVEWQVTVVDVPAGLISIESPLEGALVRVDAAHNLSVRAAVDSNLSDVHFEWTINGAVVSHDAAFEYAAAASGSYHIRLEASAVFMSGVHYTATDEVNVSVLITVPPVPDPENNGSANNTTRPPTASDGGLLWLLLLLAAAGAGAGAYFWWRKSRAREGAEP